MGSAIAHIPVRYKLHAVRIDGNQQEDIVIEDAQCFGIRLAHHIVREGEQVLGRDAFGGVQPAVDPDNGLAFDGQLVRLIIRQPFCQRQPP